MQRNTVSVSYRWIETFREDYSGCKDLKSSSYLSEQVKTIPSNKNSIE